MASRQATQARDPTLALESGPGLGCPECLLNSDPPSHSLLGLTDTGSRCCLLAPG